MIPFVDLKVQYSSIKAEIDAAVLHTLDSTQFILGSDVAAFEEDFASYCGVDHAIGVNSGTSALHLALLAAGVGPGSEVITVPNTFVATVAAIEYCGARPVFVDIEPRYFNLDPEKLENAITSQTKAILPVHLYGQTADMDPIVDVARRHGVAVIEDACQAHGAEDKGRRAGSLGDLGCFSFYPGKNLGAYGEGGAVVTSNAEFAAKIRMLRDWGQKTKYHHVLKGFNYRLEGIQGAILRVKLKYLEQWTESRRHHAALYGRLLAGVVVTPEAREDSRHVYHLYAIRSANRAKLQSELTSQGIQTGIHYPIPVHLMEAYRDLGYGEGSFPEAERAAREVLSLPMYPELRDEQIRTVAHAVRTAQAVTAAHDLAAPPIDKPMEQEVAVCL
jgi:dTDP-4-amino-4,6-dideoxygalactose transaminase